MKNDITTTLLNFLLAVLVILSVAFALLTIHRERDLRQLTINATIARSNLTLADTLIKDVVTYNATAKSPGLTHILQDTQAKLVAH